MSLPAPRTLLFLIVLAGGAGLALELLLLEHFDGWRMLLPFVALALLLAASLAVLRRPTRGMLHVVRGLAALCVLLGALGVWYHYTGNAAFELERHPAMAGWALLRAAFTGGVPALAPGALAQLGLVAFAATYGHPALRRDGATPPPSDLS